MGHCSLEDIFLMFVFLMMVTPFAALFWRDFFRSLKR